MWLLAARTTDAAAPPAARAAHLLLSACHASFRSTLPCSTPLKSPQPAIKTEPPSSHWLDASSMPLPLSFHATAHHGRTPTAHTSPGVASFRALGYGLALPHRRHMSKQTTGATETGEAASELHVTVEPLADAYEGVSVITLNRPAARNAIGRRLLRELAEAVDLLRQERTTRCVVLRSSAPGVFSAGADLKERATMTQAETIEFVTLLRRSMTEVQALPMPTIAAIDGFALGGGAELALAADIRVAGAGAVFAFPEAQLGIIPGAGGTQRLPRLLGASRAKELIFTGRRVTAAEALELGLVDHVVEGEGGAYAKALEMAAAVAKSAPLSLRMAKAAINHGMDVDMGTGLRMEEAYYAQLVHTKDRLEGLKAFAEKRPPVWNGE